jgi:ABC-type phosphate/phosphonate transport system substrate-binding protein
LGSQNLDVLRGRTFCRLGYDDFYSWLVPTLYMESVSIDPQRDLVAVVDYSNIITLVRAVADGECTATGISQDTYDTLNATHPDLLEEVRVASVAIAFPYPILMYPVNLDLGVRLALNDVFMELGAELDSPFMWLLGHDALVVFEPESVVTFSAFMASTGLDLSQLGD